MKLLDVGCGPGGIVTIGLYASLAKNYEIYGIDFLRHNITSMKNRFPNGTFRQADAHKIPYKNNAFDVIFLRHCLEHVKNVEKVLKEVTRVAKQNAHVHIAVPHPFFEKAMHALVPSHSHVGHERVFSKTKLQKLLNKHHIAVEKIHTNYWPLFIIDIILGLVGKITGKLKLEEQSGMYLVNNNSYTKSRKNTTFYTITGKSIFLLNKISILNSFIPFEITAEGRIKK